MDITSITIHQGSGFTELYLIRDGRVQARFTLMHGQTNQQITVGDVTIDYHCSVPSSGPVPETDYHAFWQTQSAQDFMTWLGQFVDVEPDYDERIESEESE